MSHVACDTIVTSPVHSGNVWDGSFSNLSLKVVEENGSLGFSTNKIVMHINPKPLKLFFVFYIYVALLPRVQWSPHLGTWHLLLRRPGGRHCAAVRHCAA